MMLRKSTMARDPTERTEIEVTEVVIKRVASGGVAEGTEMVSPQ